MTFIRFLAAALLVLCLTQTARPAEQEKLHIAFVYAGPIGLQGWNYQHDQGRQAVEHYFRDRVEVKTVADLQPGADAVRLISQLAREGNRLIFVTSPALTDAVMEASKRYPETYFEIAAGEQRADNIATYNGRFYEARYILGQIAARMSQKGKIGYVAPEPGADTFLSLNAYMLGAQSVNPAITVCVAYIGTPYDAAREAAGTRAVIAQGVDVLAYQTDSPAPAQVAEQSGVMVFGNASDMDRFAPQEQLTALVQDWGGYYIKRILAVLDGKWTTATVWAGFREGIVSLGPFRHMSEKAKGEAVTTRQSLIDGRLKLFTGPLYDHDGTLRLKDGETAGDDVLRSMDWYVKGNLVLVPMD